MQDLNLPKYNLRIKQQDGKMSVFDVLRKKWINLTPEEWVRQNFIHFLLEMGYPAGRIGVEVGLTINGRKLRVDAVVYNGYGDVKMLLEFKAPSINITDETFAQAADYNTKVSAPFVVVSNGLQHYCARVEKDDIEMLNALPAYNEICN